MIVPLGGFWFHLPINPDPWAIGPVGVGRRNGKYYPYVGRNNQLDAFKKAVAEELKSQGAVMISEGDYELKFYFWRRLEAHESGSKNYADVTNLQKATEDALQGVLICNDRNVRKISSTIVEQSDESRVGISINIDYFYDRTVEELPMDMWPSEDFTPPSSNVWMGPPS